MWQIICSMLLTAYFFWTAWMKTCAVALNICSSFYLLLSLFFFCSPRCSTAGWSVCQLLLPCTLHIHWLLQQTVVLYFMKSSFIICLVNMAYMSCVNHSCWKRHFKLACCTVCVKIKLHLDVFLRCYGRHFIEAVFFFFDKEKGVPNKFCACDPRLWSVWHLAKLH